MNSKRLFYVLIGLVGLMAAGIFAGVYGANVLLQSTSQSVLEARSKSVALDQQQSDLAKAKADVKKYQEIGSIAKTIVPQDKDQAQTVRQIVKIADDNGITLTSVTFPNSSLGTAPVKTTGGAATGASSSAAAPSQLTPVPTIPGVYSLAIVLQSDTKKTVPFPKFLAFLDALEHNRRTALVNGITITPDQTNSKNVSFTLNLQEYIKP